MNTVASLKPITAPDLPISALEDKAFYTISEVADILDVPQHVLRFWETKFAQVRPLKRGGNRRYYRPEDVMLLQVIQNLLHAQGYTIRGVQKLLQDQGKNAILEHQSMFLKKPVPQEKQTPSSPPPSLLTKTTEINPSVRAALTLVLQNLRALRALLAAS